MRGKQRRIVPDYLWKAPQSDRRAPGKPLLIAMFTATILVILQAGLGRKIYLQRMLQPSRQILFPFAAFCALRLGGKKNDYNSCFIAGPQAEKYTFAF